MLFDTIKILSNISHFKIAFYKYFKYLVFTTIILDTRIIFSI